MGTEKITKVAVIGGGLMGRQIALNTAVHGIDATVTDLNEAVRKDVEVWKDDYLAGRISKGRMTADQVDKIKTLFHVPESVEEAVKDADLVIEAIIEDTEIKRTLFSQLSDLVREDTILASNSSFLPSSLFADCVTNPSRLANLHFFNPALVMKLTEVVQGPHTSEETIETLLDFSREVGKDPVWLRKEIEGFIANRLLSAVTNEALYIVDQKVATPKEVDIAAEEGLNYPMGPFKLMDLTGIDLNYLNMKREYEESGVKGPGYDLVKAKYDKKEWGRKTGKGWYDYPQK